VVSFQFFLPGLTVGASGGFDGVKLMVHSVKQLRGLGHLLN